MQKPKLSILRAKAEILITMLRPLREIMRQNIFFRSTDKKIHYYITGFINVPFAVVRKLVGVQISFANLSP